MFPLPPSFVNVIVMAIHIVDWPDVCSYPGTIKEKVVVLILVHLDKTFCARFLGSATDMLLLQVWKSLTLTILYILSGFSKLQTPWLLHWGQHDETWWHWVCKYSRRQSLDKGPSSVPERNSCRSILQVWRLIWRDMWIVLLRTLDLTTYWCMSSPWMIMKTIVL